MMTLVPLSQITSKLYINRFAYMFVSGLFFLGTSQVISSRRADCEVSTRHQHFTPQYASCRHSHLHFRSFATRHVIAHTSIGSRLADIARRYLCGDVSRC